MKQRALKAKEIEEVHQSFKDYSGVIFTDFKGMTVAEMTGLRNLLRNESLEYRVVKNTLAKKASQDTPIAVAVDSFKGPVGIAMSKDDPVMLAKKVLEFTKENENLNLKGGVIEGKICVNEEIKALSELPSKEILMSMLIGTIQSPLTKLASLLNSTITRLPYALQALKTKKSESQ